jgi:cytochrome c-type biogenesis protein CcmH/NrfG
MSDSITCPDCGTANPAESVACSHCNFPLVPSMPGVPGPAETPVPGVAAPAELTAPAPDAAEVRAFDPGPRPVRPRRARADAMEPVQMQLWLVTGVAVVLGIVYFAAQGFWKSNVRPVEGARPEQQQQADLARGELAKDSTNLAARIALANILYDTGNWSEAIVNYKAAARLDPQRATTLVDLGVCYYNLSRFAAAESLFQHALLLDPMQPVALFNLGIVSETQQHYDHALNYYHRAMQANPPEAMKQPLTEHLKAVMEKTGKSAPPLGGAR